MASPFHILHITDPHLHAERTARMRGVNTDDTLVATLQHALAARQPDLIMVTGDLVQDESRGGYERFRELLGSLGPPVCCIPGNHDDPRLMREILASPPFQLGGVVRQGNWSVIPLNTWAPGDAGGTLSPDELEFLDRSLEGASAGHCLVTLHHQPVPMGSRWLDSVPLRNADEFLAVCDRHANLRGIVWGHVHQESDRERRGVRLLSTPATCAQFTPGSDTFALDSRPPGYRWIELQPDGRIDTSVVWVAHGK